MGRTGKEFREIWRIWMKEWTGKVKEWKQTESPAGVWKELTIALDKAVGDAGEEETQEEIEDQIINEGLDKMDDIIETMEDAEIGLARISKG